MTSQGGLGGDTSVEGVTSCDLTGDWGEVDKHRVGKPKVL